MKSSDFARQYQPVPISTPNTHLVSFHTLSAETASHLGLIYVLLIATKLVDCSFCKGMYVPNWIGFDFIVLVTNIIGHDCRCFGMSDKWYLTHERFRQKLVNSGIFYWWDLERSNLKWPKKKLPKKSFSAFGRI
jgi:hypothetical protein